VREQSVLLGPLAVAVAVVLVMVPGVARADGTADNLVGLWHFDLTAEDSSGNANTGTPTDDNHLNTDLNTPPTFAAGKFKYALDFDGVDDFVEVLDAPSLDIPGDLTVEAWVQLHTLKASGTHNIISKEKSFLPLDVNYNVHILNNKLFFPLTFNDSLGGSSATIGTAGCDAGGCWVQGATALSLSDLDSFHHVAAVYDNSTKTMQVYLNGSLDGEGIFTTTGSPTTNNENVRIGKRNAFSAGTQLAGLIDEVRIWSRALTADEVMPVPRRGCAPSGTSTTTQRTARATGTTALLTGTPHSRLGSSTTP
jgi:hypothetical protein